MIDLLSPASSWNWLANLTRPARLASSLTIRSWSLSVIEGNTSCRDDKRGDPRLSPFKPTSRRFFGTHQSPLGGGDRSPLTSAPRPGERVQRTGPPVG